jgi:hypothetical protein
MICLGICEKRIQMMSGEIFGMKEVSMEFESISDDIHALIADNKVYKSFNTSPWFRKL